MSQQAVADFMKKVNEDESLQKEFDSVVTNNEGISATNQALADLGVNHGYEITAEDMEKLRLALKAQTEESDELSEEALETVAGGGIFAVAAATALGIWGGEQLNKWWG